MEALGTWRDLNMEALGTWRDLEAFATGRRTTDLRPDDGGSARDGTLADGDGGSAHDLSLVDRATTTLLLDNSNLKECVFSQLQLRALHTLSLSSNRLRCLDPGIASFATSLTVLKLECNALRSLPGATCDLGLLEVLWLGCNDLEELPARLGQLSRLRELCVDSNQLRALPTSLGDLHRLETLSAETNLLRELPAAARRLDALRRVRLRHNRLAGEHAIEPLCHLRCLAELDLRGNSLLGPLPERLGMLGELQVLRVPAAAARSALEPGHRACAASSAESGGSRLPLLVALHRRHTRRAVAVQLRMAQGGRIRVWLWSPSAAPPSLHPPPASGVHLTVYDLAEFNKWSMNVGVGVFHTAIYLELLDIELNFAALPPCGSAPAAMRRLTPRSGIFVAPRGGAARWMPVRHRQSIALGQVRLTFAEIYAALSRLEPSFAAARYNLLQHNCNAFCAAVARALLGRALPGFVDRPAAMARAVQAPIVAATWLGKLLREARATAEARAAAANPAQNDTGASAAVDGAANLLEQGPHLAPSWWADWRPSHAQRVGLPAGGGGGGSPDASEEVPLPLDLHDGGREPWHDDPAAPPRRSAAAWAGERALPRIDPLESLRGARAGAAAAGPFIDAHRGGVEAAKGLPDAREEHGRCGRGSGGGLQPDSGEETSDAPLWPLG